METITQSADETQKLGEKTGSSLKGGEVLALVGDLGSGKTTFVQGLAKGLGIRKRINSPTFILMREYTSDSLNLYHVDLYRLEDKDIKKELDNLGVRDLMTKDNNIFVIEWAEKAKDLFPESTLWINFGNEGEDQRKIIINK